MAKYLSPIDRELKKRSQPLSQRLSSLTVKLDKTVQSTITNPERSAAYWTGKRKEVNSIYSDMEESYSKWTVTNLPKSYNDSVYKSMKKAGRSAAPYGIEPKKNATDFTNGQYSKATKSILTEDAIRDYATASSLGQKNVNRYLSEAQKAANALYLAGEEVNSANIIAALSANPATKKIVDNMINSRYVQVIDKNGIPRNYKPKYYAEMVQRVKWHEAQSAAVRGVAANYNTDLIRVSAHNTTTEICQQYEGKVMSLSGKEKGFPIADQVPPYHVNCLHFITPVFIETLRATGTEQEFKDFGSGKTDAPPFPSSYVPVSDREAA